MPEPPTLHEFRSATIQTFLDELASSAPTPGGGAATALVGAMSAALVSMVCNLTIGRPRYAHAETAMRQILARSEEIRQNLAALAEADAAAYADVAAAYRLPRASETEKAARADAIQHALIRAAGPPLAVMKECRSLVPLCLQVAAHGNATVVSDAGVAAELAAASVRASILNVRINLAEIRDAQFVAQTEKEIASAEDGLEEELDRTIGIVRAKLAPKAMQ